MTKCIDCVRDGVKTVRSVVDKNGRPYGGPRSPLCCTHRRARRKATRERSRASRLERDFGITDDDYAAVKAEQGGKCAICQMATGATKALAWDHDHSCCPAPPTCGRCGRGCLCSPCNQLLGRAGDNPEFFRRAIEYLKNPPARRVLSFEEVK